MKAMTAALGVLLLTACATPQEARDAGPVQTFTSAKSAKAVADCIASKIEAKGYASHMGFRPTENGYSINVTQQWNTLYVLEVQDAGTGSQTLYYKGTVLNGEAARVEMVAACQ